MIHQPTIEAAPLTVMEARRRDLRIQREHEETARIKALGEALVYLAEVRNCAKSPFDKTLLWAEFHAAKAAKAYYGEDINDAFEIACDELGVDENGDPVSDPDDYDDFARTPVRSTEGVG